MNEPLDEQYLKWLYSHVASVRLKNPARTYWSLTRQLFRTEYVGYVPNDDNRVEDGRDLRYEFLEVSGNDPDQEWLRIPCSMLEMMIGLSRRLAFDADEGGPREWFWIMIENLDLQSPSDFEFAREKELEADVARKLDAVIWRKYDYDGRGGLFPLVNPQQDQREVELWYQMSQYLLERG